MTIKVGSEKGRRRGREKQVKRKRKTGRSDREQ